MHVGANQAELQVRFAGRSGRVHALTPETRTTELHQSSRA